MWNLRNIQPRRREVAPGESRTASNLIRLFREEVLRQMKFWRLEDPPWRRREGMSRYAFLQAEQQRSMIIDYLGGCERIRNTPLARASAIQVRQFILMFLVALPFALMGEFTDSTTFAIAGLEFNHGIYLIPLFIMLLALPMLSLDRIGMELQNPFDTRRIDHLPLDAICHTIERNLMEVLKNDSVATEEGFVLETMQLDPEMAALIAKGNARDTLIS